MYCHNCGMQLPKGAKFCSGCGASVIAAAESRGVSGGPRQPADQSGRDSSAPPRQPEQNGGGNTERKISEHITMCEDGVYRWTYEYNLFKHPGLFLLVWKVFFFVALGVFGFMMLLTLIEGDMDGERLLDSLKYFGIGVLGLTALTGLGYLIYAAIMGGKYIAVFEMDDAGINHMQIGKQAKRAEAIGIAAILAGYLTKNLSVMATGLNVRSEMYTTFRAVGKIRAYPRKDLIKLREMLSQNQVFVHPEDFEFVWSWIRDRVPDKAKPSA